MEPRIETLEEKKLVGKSLMMSLTNNKTLDVWKSFIPLQKKIENKLTEDFISMAIYKSSYFVEFNPASEFEKWAAVEVSDFDAVPEGLETFTLKAGLYAVFSHKGSSKDNSIFEYIHNSWLPNSEFVLDDRPHFEVLGEKYRNGDPDSEEEIWIPVKRK